MLALQGVAPKYAQPARKNAQMKNQNEKGATP
jgi:hypothetical protein